MRALATAEPSAAIDDAIRAAARRAVSSAPRARSSRWAVPVSIAAVLFLSFGVVMRLEQEAPPLEFAPPPAATRAPEPDTPEPAKPEPPTSERAKRQAELAKDTFKPAPQAGGRLEYAPEQKQRAAAPAQAAKPAPAPQPFADAVASKEKASASELAAAAPAKPSAAAVPAKPAPRQLAEELPRGADPERRDNAAASIAAKPTTSPAPPPAAALPAPPPTAVGSPARPPVAATAVAPAAAPAPASPPAAAPVQQAMPRAKREAFAQPGIRALEGEARDAPWPDTAEKKLERVAELRKAGRDREADEALERFRREHPDYRIAEDVWTRIKPR